jgi:outer membrane protein assembly factor BamA
MAENIDLEQLKEFLKRVGLIDSRYSGSVQVTTKTSSGSQTLTIKV